MSEVNYFLRVMKKEGYPNPDIENIAHFMGYDLQNFLPDLTNEIGENGVLDFCKKAIEQMSDEQGIRYNLPGSDDGEYVYVKLKPLFYDPNESENDIVCTYTYGESKLLGSDSETGKEKMVTIEQMIEDTGMGEWAELDEFIEVVRLGVYNLVYYNCGFGLWYQ